MKQRRRLLVVLFVLMVWLFSPIRVKAELIPTQEREVRFLVPDEDVAWWIIGELFGFYGEFSDEAQAYIIFTNLFEPIEGVSRPCIPKGVTLLSLRIDEGELILNVTADIDQHGGSTMEQAILLQILHTAAQFEGIERVTLLIEGESVPLRDGFALQKSDIEKTIHELNLP